LRPWGARPFEDRERQLLELVNASAAWLYRRQREPLRDAAGRPRPGAIRGRLPPRHRGIVDQLLTGRSEKEIAGAVGLSVRTAHKYIEQVFRAFQVSSRPELMALWIRGAVPAAPDPR
jgi:DNA-binding NarL/FixJ family response regulator